jgi:Mg-chelatase subunit ChlD
MSVQGLHTPKKALTTVVPGSIEDVAERENISVSQAFMRAELIALVDTSSSMMARDARGGEMTRYQAACDELAKVQACNPGKVAVVSFSSQARYCLGGVPLYDGGSTALDVALVYVAAADGIIEKFVVISDGEPNNERNALDVAAGFRSPIHCIYTGPEGGTGQDFLRRLAEKCRGTYNVSHAADLLADNVQLLLAQRAGGRP